MKKGEAALSIIERIMYMIDKKGLKATDLANVLHINPSVISTWKTRGKNPPAEYIVCICEFLNVSLQWLLTGEEPKAPICSPWQLTEEQAHTASIYFPDLTEEQVALLNNFEKLDARDKREIKEIIRMKLGDTMGLSSSSEGHNGASGIA